MKFKSKRLELVIWEQKEKKIGFVRVEPRCEPSRRLLFWQKGVWPARDGCRSVNLGQHPIGR